MDTFKVGEIAIIQNVFGDEAKYNGEECTVLKPYGIQRANVFETGSCATWRGYIVEISGGYRLGIGPTQLRKKRPPKREIDMLVSWDNCAWKPRSLQGKPAKERA